MRRVDADDAIVTGFVNRYRGRDGRYRFFEWRARQAGDLVYGVARDVTDRLEIEAEMAAARAAAEAANTAKSEFLANMSHEIRTPLNGVIGVAAALARTPLSAEQREMVELILASGQTLERVVSDVLDFSKIEAGRLEFDVQPFDLRAELDGPLAMFRRRAEDKGLELVVEHGPQAQGWFRGDAVRIKQVLSNLLSNAVKFTAAGEIRVAIAVREGDPAELTLEVSDTGIGFDPAFADLLFHRFSQADGSITRRFGGTGLGLSICHALVSAMGGGVTATSEPGRGSRFRVVLPLPRHAPPPAAGGPASQPAESPETPSEAPEGPRILLAEDHAINRRVVELILEPLVPALVQAQNGEQAVQAFQAGLFDLVLMDMQMPVMDGLTATRAMREIEAQVPERRRTPIIMLTANAMRQHETQAIEAGADLHLAKPVTAEGLLQAVTRALRADG
jgi:signal transduction histidine kinase/CheY-like chemotaxis protein